VWAWVTFQQRFEGSEEGNSENVQGKRQREQPVQRPWGGNELGVLADSKEPSVTEPSGRHQA
jgi:hypothetical protein